MTQSLGYQETWSEDKEAAEILRKNTTKSSQMILTIIDSIVAMEIKFLSYKLENLTSTKKLFGTSFSI